MTSQQFETREEFEAYLADPNRERNQATANRTAIWKSIPMVIGAFAIGFVIVISYSNLNDTADNLGSAKGSTNSKQAERWETMLSWLGVDVDKYRREQQERMGLMKDYQAPEIEMPDLSAWNSSYNR